VTIRSPICRPLVTCIVSESLRYGDWSKIADFNLPHLYLAPSMGVTSLEFRGDLWLQKLESVDYRMVLVVWFLCLAMLIQCRLVTDRQTDGHDDSVYCATIALRGKRPICVTKQFSCWSVCWNMAILSTFKNSGHSPSWIRYTRVWTTHRVSGGLCHCAKFVWNWYYCFDNMQVLILGMHVRL